MATTREELYSYLFAIYRISPKPAPSVQAFRDLVQEHRAGRPVQRELLAAAAPILGKLAPRYQLPGDAVSDFWKAIIETKKETPKDIEKAIRAWLRDAKIGEESQAAREENYQVDVLGENTSMQEGLPAWFFEQTPEDQRILLGVILDESNAERAEDRETNVNTEKSNQRRLFEELRKKLHPDPAVSPHLRSEPRATPKPSARGSKKTK